MAPCPEHCLPYLRAHRGTLVLGTPEHSKAQGSKTAAGPKEEFPPRKGCPERAVTQQVVSALSLGYTSRSGHCRAFLTRVGFLSTERICDSVGGGWHQPSTTS